MFLVSCRSCGTFASQSATATGSAPNWTDLHQLGSNRLGLGDNTFLTLIGKKYHSIASAKQSFLFMINSDINAVLSVL